MEFDIDYSRFRHIFKESPMHSFASPFEFVDEYMSKYSGCAL